MTKADERNLQVREFVNTRVGLAKTKGPEDFQEYGETSEIHKLLTDLIEVKSRGFRGVVVTAIAGLHLTG